MPTKRPKLDDLSHFADRRAAADTASGEALALAGDERRLSQRAASEPGTVLPGEERQVDVAHGRIARACALFVFPSVRLVCLECLRVLTCAYVCLACLVCGA